MYKYAQIKSDKVVGFISSFKAANDASLILVEGELPSVNSTYANGVFIDPAISSAITIDALVNGVTFLSAALNDTVNFTASFSDKTLNIAKLEISVVDRLGGLIENLNMAVVNGEGIGSLVVDKPIDYLLTNAGINYHKQAISADLQLSSEIVIRVS